MSSFTTPRGTLAVILAATVLGPGCIFGIGTDGSSDETRDTGEIEDGRSEDGSLDGDGGASDADGGCEADVDLQKEECDGEDNDCDGVVDEGCPCTYEGVQGDEGVCEDQTIGQDGECQKPRRYQREESNCTMDGYDNDCDGDTDCEDEDCQKLLPMLCPG